jgi:FkbM family methyltransferase
LKPLLAATFDRIGLEVSLTPARRTPARRLREVFAALDIDCVVDVGANEGQYGRMLRDEVGYLGRIASVEPAQRPFARLRAAAGDDPEWLPFNFGLGDIEETAALHVVSADDLSSLHALNDYGRRRFEGTDEVATEAVDLRRLDVMFDELVDGHDRVFLKIDTQGHDLSVLSGLGDRRVSGLQIELSFLRIYDGTPTYREAFDLIDGLGYALCGFFPVTHSSDGLFLIEADGVFVRRDLMSTPDRTI